jgi:NADH:ubiquinone oxidoreductase subunit K
MQTQWKDTLLVMISLNRASTSQAIQVSMFIAVNFFSHRIRGLLKFKDIILIVLVHYNLFSESINLNFIIFENFMDL